MIHFAWIFLLFFLLAYSLYMLQFLSVFLQFSFCFVWFCFFLFFGLLFWQIPFDGRIITFLRITFSLQAACVAVAALMQYFLMASFCWMLVEGIYIYFFVVKVYNITDKMHRYHGFCWGEEHRREIAWGNVSILIGQNQTEQKDLKMTLFFNSLNVSEIIGSSSGVPKLIVKYFWCSLELVIVADIVG